LTDSFGGGRWIRTISSAKGPSAFANFPGPAYFGCSGYRGHAYTSRRGGRHGSAFLLLRLEPLHRAGLERGMSRLWRAARRGGTDGKTQIYLRPLSARPAIAERPDQGINAVRRIPRRGLVDIRVVEAHDVEMVPHQTQPTIGHTANLHLVASVLHMTNPCEWNDTTPRQHSIFENPPDQPMACSTYRPDPISVYKSTRPN